MSPWRSRRPVLLAVVLAPLSLYLGYVGYRSSAELGLSASDALYGSLQLFTLGGAIPTNQTPWQLDLARFLAPVAVVYAAVIAVVALLRDHAQRLLVGALARDHALVVGLGTTGLLVAEGLRRNGQRVVALELDPSNHRVAVARAGGVRVVVGDALSPALLRRLKVERARHVVVMTADDSTNLEVAALVRHVVGERRRTVPMTLHVAIGHAELWKQLDQIQLTDDQPRVTTQYVNLADRTAQRLVGALVEAGPGQSPDHVLVDGDTALASRVVAHLVRRALLSGSRPRIDLLGLVGSDLLTRLRQDESWCEAHADVRVVAPEDVHREQAPLVVVCRADDDAETISRGLVLARQMPQTEVVVSVSRQHSDSFLGVGGLLADRLHLVPAEIDALAEELLARSSVELMARGRHDDYVARERAKGSTPATNSSLVSWQKLDNSLKESNREFARSTGRTMRTLGASLVPLTSAACDVDQGFDPSLLEQLARAEHERWMSALRRDGWEHTTGVKDPVARRHPLLVPWEALSESEQEKDRDAFRSLPRMYARTGYALTFAGRTAS